jgi:pimeloyl-ACP methyl ester carboxylesterase
MSTYALLPGAGGDSWYWHLVAPRLQEAGHEAIAVDLPADDDNAGLEAYADAIVDAVGDREEVVVVAQSMAAFSGPMAAERIDAQRFILVCPMIPTPDESPGEWWDASGQTTAQREADIAAGRDPDAQFDPIATFLHDLPADTLEEAMARGAPEQSGRPFGDPWPLDSWPDLPTRVIAGRHDRLFPLPFMQALSQERLGIDPEVVDSGHLPALARPDELAQLLAQPPAA